MRAEPTADRVGRNRGVRFHFAPAHTPPEPRVSRLSPSPSSPVSPQPHSLSLDQDVGISRVQHSFTYQLLGHGNRLVHGHAEVGQVI